MVKTNKYLDKYRMINQNKELQEIEQYGIDNNVPIITKDSLETVLMIMNSISAKKILEIGTAIGYSSSCFVINTDRTIDTIERNQEMYDKAKANIKKLDLEKQVNIIFSDALEIDNNLLQQDYDILFIDAAKAQSIKFFNKFEPNLKENGIIVSDNLELLDLQRLTQSKRSKRLVEKMNEYKEFLNSLENYETEYLEIGDGFAITKKVL